MYITDKGILDDKDYVICTTCALARTGLTTHNGQYLVVFTQFEELHNKDYGIAGFVYNSDINTTDYVTRGEYNPHLLFPTQERAIVESIIHLDGCDEGELVEAIDTYLLMHNNDTSKLEEVADHFKLSRDALAYWIDEALNNYEE